MQRDTRVALAKQLAYIILTNNDTGVLAKYMQFWSIIADILILLLFHGRIKASPTPCVLFASATTPGFLGTPHGSEESTEVIGVHLACSNHT